MGMHNGLTGSLRAICAFVMGAGCLWAGAAGAQELWTRAPNPMTTARQAVLTGSDAYIVLPPDVVSGANGLTQKAVVSPDGAYILVERSSALRRLKSPTLPQTQKKRADADLLLWNVAERRGTVLWQERTTDKAYAAVHVVGWLPGTSTALVEEWKGGVEENSAFDETKMQHRLLSVDAVRGSRRALAILGWSEEARICPTRPVAVLTPYPPNTIRFVRADGTLGQNVSIDRKNILWWGWRDDGKTFYGYAVTHDPEMKGKPATSKVETVYVDMGTGAVTIKDGKLEMKVPANPKAFRFTPPSLTATFGDATTRSGENTQSLRSLWLSGTDKDAQGRFLLAADVDDKPLILPNAIVYQSHGIVFAVPLIRLDRDAFITERRKVYQAETISRAKQIGLALLGYAADNKDNFPPVGSDKDTYGAYVKNDSVFNNPETGKLGLSLVYQQTSTEQIQSPGEYILGYLSGAGGRAIIYADGHVKWQDDVPKSPVTP